MPKPCALPDALTMDRCDRPAFSDVQTLDMLAEQRGQAFDPQVVDAVLAQSGAMMALRDQVTRQGLGFDDLSRPDVLPAPGPMLQIR